MTDVLFAPEAAASVSEIDDWWRENRLDSPLLFLEELEHILELLESNPLLGKPFPRDRHPELRRLILTRTRYHLYYEYQQSDDLVWVVDVWGAVRGQEPPDL